MEPICPHCTKLCKSLPSMRSHATLCKSNPNRKKSGFEKSVGRAAWNKGQTARTSSAVAKQAESLRQANASGKVGHLRTAEVRSRLSQVAKENRLGGYRPHPNRGIRYNGVWFDSRWEEQVARSLDAEGVKWERPRRGFVWSDDGRKYYPDFYLPEFDIYLDPKNSYLQRKDAVKIEQAQARNNIKVFVLDEHQLQWKDIAAVAQLVERRLGKAEVTSSNLVSSTNH